MKRRQVIVIVGPTGSGKTGVSLEIAKEVEKRGLGGYSRVEIISADSRAIYKEMDLGTAKPTLAEQRLVKHWGIDLVNPGQRFTVADWKMYTEAKIEEIFSRGNLPIIVGGTGLYVDALIYDYSFGVSKKVVQNGKIEYPDRQEMCSRYRVFGIKVDSDILRQRLYERANKLFNQALYDEMQNLIDKYGWNNQAMKSNIYQFAFKFLNGELSREEAIRLNVLDDYHLAKRQMTWFKRNDKIVWLSLDKIKQSVLKCIQDE